MRSPVKREMEEPRATRFRAERRRSLEYQIRLKKLEVRALDIAFVIFVLVFATCLLRPMVAHFMPAPRRAIPGTASPCSYYVDGDRCRSE